MPEKYVFINNSFIAENLATLHISDLSVQRGYGIFDFFKTINGQPIFIKDHLERFYHSAASMHLPVKQSPDQLESILMELLAKNNIQDSGVKLILTGGYSDDGYTQPAVPNLVITQHPLSVPLEFNFNGINLVTYNYQRQLPEMKTIDYSMAIWLQPFIKENSADDVLYHSGGLVKEVPRANFFIVTADGEIVTAKSNVLRGVIRGNILNLKDSGFRITERDFDLEELYGASEAFITSTTKHILPVLRVNDKVFKQSSISKRLSDLLLQKVRSQI